MDRLGFTRIVDEATIRSIVDDILINYPDKVDNIIRYYSKLSGISLEYVDLITAIRGLIR